MKKAFLFVLFACTIFTAAAACTYTPTNLKPLDGSDRGIEEFKDHP
jgi:hypothetical protein